jgi:predicted DCC family thiol-disulfide oxidoreductase YuxK
MISRKSFHDFWFQPISAAGFGMMRVAFGGIGFLTFALQWSNVTRFYTTDGILPHALMHEVTRSVWRFSLLDYVPPSVAWTLYLVLLLSFLMTMLGIRTKVFLSIAVILLFSFDEYALITLDGGDTLMRLIGFILLLSPCHKAMTLTNLTKRMELVRRTGKDQPASERTMPIWPYRLLLWQMIILYVASSVEKFMGNTWRVEGSAVAITLHHGMFSRLSPALADMLAPTSPFVGWFVLITQFAWVLLLILPLFIWIRFLSASANGALKRALILCGVLVHGMIFLLMDVGTFSLTVFVSYLGLLLDEDFIAVRQRWNRKRKGNIAVLFDGRCGLCRRSVVTLKSFDWLKRLEFVNFRDAALKKKFAANIDEKQLDEQIHIRLPSEKFSKGFYAFRDISWHLPPLWVAVPLLYVPGVPNMGEKIYAWVAKNRTRCTDDRCAL